MAAGGTVLVRQWFDNDGEHAETEASVSTQIPDGFTLNGGSTKVCLNPSTTEPASPDSSELACASSNEAAVWSGASLAISPGAGHFGESNGAATGVLDIGKVRYLNLHQCHYRHIDHGNSESDGFATVGGNIGGPVAAGTNASNVADAAAVCGDASGWPLHQPGFSSSTAIDLLGNRYLNLHQCGYRHINHPSPEADVRFTLAGPVGGAVTAGTNASNSIDGAPSCGAADSPAWSDYVPNGGTVRTLDLQGNRYINLHQCYYRHVNHPAEVDFIFTFAGGAGGPVATGTNASNVVDGSVSCGAADTPGWASYDLQGGTVRTLDLLDPGRSRGYVEYALTAPPGPSPEACAANPAAGSESFDQDGSLTSVPSGVQASSGTITVDWSTLEDPCPTDPIPLGDPLVVGAGLVALAGAGYVVLRRRQDAIA